ARHPGQLFDCLWKAHPGLLGQEPEVVAGHAAAKAVIDALAIVGMKARRLLAVERAARPIVAPARLALSLVPDDMLAHDLMDRQALPDFIEEAVGKAHGGDVRRRPAEVTRFGVI